MMINISKDGKLFHLQTLNTSYVIKIMDNGFVQHLYYGRKIHVKENYKNLGEIEKHGFEIYVDQEKPYIQPALIKREYAEYGRGDFRDPAYQVTLENGSRISELKYTHYLLTRGKRKIDGLPSSFGTNGETLTLVLRDEVIGLEVRLNYTIFADSDVIVRNTEFYNKSQKNIELNRAMSLMLDLPDSSYNLLQFSGAWLRERRVYKTTLRPGSQTIASARYASSPQHNPFFVLARKNANQDSGGLFGFNFIYSGNFVDAIEVDHYDQTRVNIGINPFEFSFDLEPSETFITPEALMIFEQKGLNGLSLALSKFYQKHLIVKRFSHFRRPIVLNTWEGNEFAISSQSVLESAKKAQALGIELVVIDDGWFGRRTDDTSSLGDWFVDKKRFPEGLAALSEKIHQMGMKLGLWFEPEMVSKDSKLYKSHPEWVIASPNREPAIGRKQQVLDFANQKVVDYIYDQMVKVIEETKLDYIKWDMNRHITDAYSVKLSSVKQKEVGHRYILGLYQLLEKLTERFPDLLIESCSSGGGRFDLGMMAYAPQAWVSDDTDPIERLRIQEGTSYGYSLSMMGAHVTANPNQQSQRELSIDLKAHVAYFGLLGYELDLLKLSDSEMVQIKEQIQFYKKYRDLFQFGDFYRLCSSDESNVFGWQVVDAHKAKSVVLRVQLLGELNPGYSRILLKGLEADSQYRISGYEELFFGDELMNAGLTLLNSEKPHEKVIGTRDFAETFLILEKVEK